MHKRTVTFTMWRPPWLHRCKPPPQSWLIGSRFMWGYPIRCFVTPPSTSLTTCAHPCGWGAKTCSTGTIFYLLVVRVRAGVRGCVCMCMRASAHICGQAEKVQVERVGVGKGRPPHARGWRDGVWFTAPPAHISRDRVGCKHTYGFTLVMTSPH